MTPEPGEMRRMAYTSVARGADGVMFFRWRPAHFGAEIYWMGIIDHDDVPRRRYEEAKQFATEINAIKTEILGTHVRMDVGIAGSDFDNQEAHRTYPMGLPSPHDDGVLLHRHCYRAGIACGYIHPADDLSRLKLLYIPHWLIWKDEWTANVEAFARNGGTVIFSARTGSRDGNNHVIREAAPGKSVTALTGVAVEEFGRLAPLKADGVFDLGGRTSPAREKFPAESARRRYTLKIGNHEMTAAHMYELLTLADDVTAIGSWSNRFASGTPVLTSRLVGKGRVLYLGTYLTDEVVGALDADVFARSSVEPLLANVPAGVEVSMRIGRAHCLLFILNTRDEETVISGMQDGSVLVCDGAIVDGTLTLPGYGCAIIKITS